MSSHRSTPLPSVDTLPLFSRLKRRVLKDARFEEALEAAGQAHDGVLSTIPDERDAVSLTRGLHPRELEMARSMSPERRNSFIAGRLALHRALHELDTASPRLSSAEESTESAILRTARGAPALPQRFSGSISHKMSLALAAVAPLQVIAGRQLLHLGIDLETKPLLAEPGRPSIASRILTVSELRELESRGLDPLRALETVRIHFAIKEAVYKAIDPLVHRYVGFREVELSLADRSRMGQPQPVRLLLPELSGVDVQVEAEWWMDSNWIVASAYSTGPLP